jgi:hypothetical protein
MAMDGAGGRLAELLLPYCRREREEPDGPDHETGWWFTGAPPDVVREALDLVQAVPGERANDQPPEEWLVAQAAIRHGALAGFVAPADQESPRMRVDMLIVPCSEVWRLADEIASLWPVDGSRLTALDIAAVEGYTSIQARDGDWLWGVDGSEFARSRDNGSGWLGASHCGFWWD